MAPTAAASLGDWLAYLERLHPKTIDLGLARVAAVRDRLGLVPAFPVITVAGTNGKGSTCAYLESIFTAAGRRVGLYTSPHLLRYNERVRIGGVEADDRALVEAFAAVEAARGDVSLTYFEFGTLAAMVLFIRAGVDVAVLEVGLGGRLDAVNVFDADCAVVTGIALDHTDWLGTDRESIGAEKAGVFRPGRPAICADPDPPASVAAHAAEVGAELRQAGRDFAWARSSPGWRFQGHLWFLDGLPLPGLAGAFQLNNAAAALATLEALSGRLPVDGASLRQGLAAARVAGRFQRVRERPEVILDVAHNPQAAEALAALLAERPVARQFAVFAMLGDKDVGGVAARLAPLFDGWFVAGLDVPRGVPAATLAEALEQAGARGVTVCADVADACRRACDAAEVDDRIAAFGSFHTVADALRHFGDSQAT